MKDFGPGVADALRAGRAVRCPDVSRAPDTDAFAAAFEALAVRSFVAAPLVRSGDVAGICLAVVPAPRHWAKGDVALIHEVGERVWNAVERLRAPADRQHSEERLRLALEAAQAGTFQCWPDPDRPPLVSDSLLRLFGFAPGERPTAADFIARIHPEDRAFVRDRMHRSMDRAEGHFLEYRVQRPDGSIVYLASRAEPVQGPDGGAACMRGALPDITERNAAEAEQTPARRRRRPGAGAASVCGRNDAGPHPRQGPRPAAPVSQSRHGAGGLVRRMTETVRGAPPAAP